MEDADKLPLVQKLVEKKTIGYRCTTMDFVQFETNNEKGKLYIDDEGEGVIIDLTPKNIEIISEFIRYVKSDMEVSNE